MTRKKARFNRMLGTTSAINTSGRVYHRPSDDNNAAIRRAAGGYQQRPTITGTQTAKNDDMTKYQKQSIVKCSNVKENKETNCSHTNNNLSNNSKRIRNFTEDELQKLFSDQYYALKNNPLHQLGPLEADQKTWEQYYSFPRLFIMNGADDNQLAPFVLQPSLFHRNNVPPTIYFNTRLSEESKPPVGLPKSFQNLFKWKISLITPNSIRSCVTFMKFETLKTTNTTDQSYLGSWCKHMPTSEFANLEEYRKVNHYPGSFHMGRKDKLWLRLRQANDRYKLDSFHPQTFVLPRDFKELKEFWQKSPSNLFIIKPPASARGNGIRVINHISQIPESALKLPEPQPGAPTKKSTMIVQQYISNPCLLENGQKFDLRIYVLLTSVDPLRIYVCNDGLVRFASSKYSIQESGIIDQYMHLTNYFVNKNNQEYQVNNDCESLNGNKWTLKRFWRHLNEHYKHVDTDKLWDQIVDIIIKTVVFCEGPMSRLSNQNCKNDYTSYELFGFDILLDQNFKPWILEVNITPSLKTESRLDTSVKYGVIKDMFNLVGYNLPPSSVDENFQRSKFNDCKIFFNPTLYTENPTRIDNIKRAKYLKLHKFEKASYFRSINNTRNITNDANPEAHQQEQQMFSQTLSQTQSSQHAIAVAEQQEATFQAETDQQQQLDQKPDQNTESESMEDNKLTIGDNILSDLTESDLRVLMLAEDELSRCGQFKRVFPSKTSSKYLNYFDKPRYYNLLLDAWEQRYSDGNRMEGIKRLSNLAAFLS